MIQEFWINLMGLVAVVMQYALLYVDHGEEKAVSKLFLHIPRYTNEPALGSHRNT
jgi:hypothetical protein